MELQLSEECDYKREKWFASFYVKMYWFIFGKEPNF